MDLDTGIIGHVDLITVARSLRRRAVGKRMAEIMLRKAVEKERG